MELFIPFMLFILDLRDDTASGPVLSRHPALYASEAACRQAGETIIRERIAADERDAPSFAAFCERVPENGEYDALLRELDQQRGNREDRSQ
ncbi:hypothetical protein [Erythrobacter ani]|uniref:Uncharacterized protein n=1 Tax=Erythrobacter ani TaxID=2827235 RepID=A0ABS6SPG6_9SPHN|nr:hypothetical protein [Erythrobacter ani]MBV7266907.1 hypothetical protein [Erythrobacter ani]